MGLLVALRALVYDKEGGTEAKVELVVEVVGDVLTVVILDTFLSRTERIFKGGSLAWLKNVNT